VQQEDIIISVGPKTIAELQKAIARANTIIINGLPGFEELPSTMHSTHALLTAITNSHAYTVLCGGDSIARAQEYSVLSHFTYVSTGGGATITYLAGQLLPGLQYL
jgi:phosphoglycerate kinase